MNYTLHQLQVFLKVAETRSITKAAEALHLTQPAVSIQLKKLQDQFDIPLTEVVGKRLFITDFGKEIEEAAQQIIDQAYAIQHKTLAYKGHLVGKLKISVVSTGKYVMPYFLVDFFNQHEGVQLEMDVTNKLKVVETLENNEVDFSLVSIIPDHIRVERLDLISNKLYLVAKHDFTPEGEENPTTFFSRIPLIYREFGSGTRQTMERFIQELKVEVNRKLELSSNEAVKQAVLAGLGLSIMPLIGIRNELMQGQLKIIPIAGLPIQTTWSLIWLKGKRHSPAAVAFLEYIKQTKQETITRQFDWYEQYK
ncbi:MAG: LysR family transcriptional regulator [Bacteroidota bacterium]